jgi:lipoate-protein ligase B
VTWHGFALNVTPEPLEKFGLIVPCGIPDVRMTCLETEGASTDPERLRQAIAAGFEAAFEAEVSVGPAVLPGEDLLGLESGTLARTGER